MVTSVSSYDEVDEFMYPLGGNYNSRFPDGDYFDKLSWLAKTNRFSYLSQQVGGGYVTHEETGSLHLNRAAMRATWS